ncbi:MAG: GNAT family N-acetyltransferase [Litorimonas sp.]
MSLHPNVQITLANSPEDIQAVKSIFTEYLTFIEAYLGQSLSFQGTQTEFADFPHTYDALYLAKIDGKPVAACGVKPFDTEVCELKRLYCRPDGRGNGLGLKLTQKAMQFAKAFGYKDMYLDTDHGLYHANTVYQALGFQDIDKYYDSPMDSRFMSCNLTSLSNAQ